MEEMAAISYFDHLGAHNRAETYHAVSFALLLLLIRQIVGAGLLLIDHIFAEHRRKIGLDFLIIEVIDILYPHTPTHHHNRQRVDLLGGTPHLLDDADRHDDQPDEKDPTQHSQHDHQDVAWGLLGEPDVQWHRVWVQVHKGYWDVVGASRVDGHGVLSVGLVGYFESSVRVVHNTSDLPSSLLELDGYH